MALSDKWTRATLRDAVRRELMDPTAKWWTDAELNLYIQEWIDTVQGDMELVWGTATVTTSTSTLTLTSVATDIQRPDAVYFNNQRLAGRTPQDLEVLHREWIAAALQGGYPSAVFQRDSETLTLWPPLASAGTVTMEYPKDLTLSTDTATVALPAWTKYSAIPFCCYKAYMRPGPNNNPTRAMRYKAGFQRAFQRLKSIYTNFFPDHYPQLRPGGTYEGDILNPPSAIGTIGTATYGGTMGIFLDCVPTGDIDGTNGTFVLSTTPTELQLFRNGLLQALGTDADYTFSGTTVVFTTDATPQVGDRLMAWIYRVNT